MSETGTFKLGDQTIHYKLERLIGGGAFGTVYYATFDSWNADEKLIDALAIKRVQITSRNRDIAEVPNKIGRLVNLKHENIVRYFASDLNQSEHPLHRPYWVIVMEYVSGCNLGDYLKDRKLRKEAQIRAVLQLTNGVAFLHQNRIVHTDLKPDNILVKELTCGKTMLKIADVDDPVILDASRTRSCDVKTIRGTIPYMSPEMAGKEFGYMNSDGSIPAVGRKTDIWSLGCVFLDLAGFVSVQRRQMNNGNFTQQDFTIFLRELAEGKLPVVDPRINLHLRDLVEQIFQLDPDNRPRAEAILCHTFLKSVPQFMMGWETCAIKLATMGRPFQLGMLYDIRTDRAIPGVAFWDHEVLRANIDTFENRSTKLNIIASDSLSDKMSSMEIEAELQMSFLAGLVSVQGSAKYLDDRTKFSRDETLHYSCTTRFEQLALEHLRQDQHPERSKSLELDSATHVVVRIAYGADAFFSFERTPDSTDIISEVHEKLLVELNKIPNININGKSELEPPNMEMIESINCKYYGDFELDTNSKTYKQANEIYQKPPSLLRLNKNGAVSKTVWLYPLALLDSRLNQQLRQISSCLTDDCARIIEDLHHAKCQVVELQTSAALQYFLWINLDAECFLQCLEAYEASFRRELCVIVPKIRGCVSQEEELAQYLADHWSSPFSKIALTGWLSKRRRELMIMEAHLEGLMETPVELCFRSGEIDKLLYKKNAPALVTLEFCLSRTNDPVLEVMKAHCNEKSPDLSADSGCWFDSETTLASLFLDVQSFLQFAHRNEDWPNTKFVVCMKEVGSNPSTVSRIALYNSAGREDFSPPSPPLNVKIDQLPRHKLKISWDCPAAGVECVKEYECMYGLKTSSGLCTWQTKKVDGTDVEVSVEGNGTFVAKIRGITSNGTSDFSETAHFPDCEGQWFPIRHLQVELCIGPERTLMIITLPGKTDRVITEFDNVVIFRKSTKTWHVPNEPGFTPNNSDDVRISDFVSLIATKWAVKKKKQASLSPFYLAKEQKTGLTTFLMKNESGEIGIAPEEMFTFFLAKACRDRACQVLQEYRFDVVLVVAEATNELQLCLIKEAAIKAGFHRVRVGSRQISLMKCQERINCPDKKALSSLKHDNVIIYLSQLCDWSKAMADQFVIMDLLPCKTIEAQAVINHELMSAITLLFAGLTLEAELEKKSPLSSTDALAHFRQVCSGLQYLHSNGIVHGDLRPGNVLLFPSSVTKLLKLWKPEQGHLRGFNSNPRWKDVLCFSPEMAGLYLKSVGGPLEEDDATDVGFPTDIWSAACLITCMLRLLGILEFQKPDNSQIIMNDKMKPVDIALLIRDGSASPWRFATGERSDSCVKDCFGILPESRPNMQQLLRSLSNIPGFPMERLSFDDIIRKIRPSRYHKDESCCLLYSARDVCVIEAYNSRSPQIIRLTLGLIKKDKPDYITAIRMVSDFMQLTKGHPLKILAYLEKDMCLGMQQLPDFVIICPERIVRLEILFGGNVKGPVLDDISCFTLPNLLHLFIWGSDNIDKVNRIRKEFFTSCPLLKVLGLNSKLWDVMEDNALKECCNLQHVYTYGPVEVGWLQKYLRDNPNLVARNKEGELWDYTVNGYRFCSQELPDESSSFKI